MTEYFYTKQITKNEDQVQKTQLWSKTKVTRTTLKDALKIHVLGGFLI